MEWTAPEDEHARTDIKRAPSATRRGAKDVHFRDKGLDRSHLTKQNRMIPRFAFTRSEVRRSHYHRWGHQHADSPESPVQQTYQALGQYATTQSMTSSRMLVQVVRAIQETSKIVASRGVDLRRYRGKMLAYRMPMSPSVNTAMAAPT